MPEQKTKLNQFLDHILHINEKDLNLKFIFDHIRNYGIAASVVAIGLFLIKHGTSYTVFPKSGIIFGIALITFGFILLILNLMQPIWAMVQHKIKMLPYLIMSLLFFLTANEFFWGILNQAK